MALPTNSMLEPMSNRPLERSEASAMPISTLHRLHCGWPLFSREGTWKTQTLLFKVFKVPRGGKNKTKENRNKQTKTSLLSVLAPSQNGISRGNRRVLIIEFKAIKLTSFPLSLAQTLELCLHLQTGLSRGPFGDCCCCC